SPDSTINQGHDGYKGHKGKIRSLPGFGLRALDFSNEPVPNLPDPPDPPDVPDLPDLPGLPDLPDLPGLPDLPDFPALPDLPEPRMSAASSAQVPSTQPDLATRTGGWLFRHRTAMPLPIAIAVLTLRIGEAAPNRWLVAAGLALSAAGELTRVWAVRHIGTISRTRSDRLGPLVASGPFAFVRNPLYIGNIALWTGFAITARLLWPRPLVIAPLGAACHAVVRCEEEQ